MKRGAFIVLEGIDGSGTTTQAEQLADTLRARCHQVLVTREPTSGPIGRLLRRVLTGDLEDNQGRKITFDWAAMALLFSADRLDHLKREIEPALAAGMIVVCDRYDLSSLIYQTVTAPNDSSVRPWVLSLNARATRPDCTIVLDVPEDVARRRREARAEQEELYEKSELQRRLAAEYRRAPSLLPGDRIACVKGEGTVAQVAETIRQELAKVSEFAWMGLTPS